MITSTKPTEFEKCLPKSVALLLRFAKSRGLINDKKFQTPVDCSHRLIDDRGEAVCFYHDSAPGDCRPELCPLGRSLITSKKTRGK
jgi:hypothetical protein